MTDEANWNGDAPFSDNFHWVDTDGFRHQITVRANTGAQLLERIDAARTNLMKRGATPSGQSAPPADGGAPEIEQGDIGESVCAMIEIGTAYKSGKTQLKFHCDGQEYPLTFTKEVGEMVKLLSPLNIGADQIVIGHKIPVNAKVSWQQGEKYKNVISVGPR